MNQDSCWCFQEVNRAEVVNIRTDMRNNTEVLEKIALV